VIQFRTKFAPDSLVEGAGFEPSVPLEVLTVGIVPCRLRGPFHASLPKTKFAADSALGEDGFELPVPPTTGSFSEQASSTPPAGNTSRNRGIRPERDRWFESVFLQRRVTNELIKTERVNAAVRFDIEPGLERAGIWLLAQERAVPLTSQSSLITPSERGASFETTLVDLRSPSLREYQRDPRGRDREFCPVAASVRWNISFPAPRPFHPSACKRRHGITDQSSIRPSSTAAAASPQSSAAFSSKRSSENHPSPKPAPRQIPIDGQAPTAFPRVRSSEAFRRRPPLPGRPLAPGRHPKPFTEAAIPATGAKWCHLGVPCGVPVANA